MTTSILKKAIILSLSLLVSIGVSQAANRYWISNTSANWNSTANWSTTSGGPGGASIPVAADLAIFDGNGNGNCTFNVVVSVAGLQLGTTYSGTILHGSNTLTVGTSGYTQAGGTFNSTGSTISISGNFTVTGGTFTQSSGTIIFNRNAANQINVNNSITFNNLTFNGAGVSCTYNLNSDTVIVNGTLSFTGTSRCGITNSIIMAKGNILSSNSYTGANTHTGGLILINGSGNQTLTGSHASAIQGFFPTIQIDKPSGALFLSNKICIEGNWAYYNGTLDYTTNANTICFIYGKNFLGNNHDLGNVEFNTPTTTNSAFNLGSVILTVNGTLTLSGGTGQLQLQNSTINTKGNIVITHTRTSSNSSSTLILINGTGNQTITGTITANQGRLPAVTINKSSGTLFLVNNITIEGNYIYTAGSIDYTSNANTVCFFGVGTTLTISGSHNLGNVNFVGNGGASNVYALGTTVLTINGDLTFSGTSQFKLTASTGSIHAKGNINITNTYLANNNHTATINVNGIPDQSITSSVAAGNGRLPNISINKTTGNVLLSGVISVEGNWTYTAGSVLSQTSTVTLYNAAKTIDGEGTSSTMQFYNLTLGDASTRTMLGDLTVQNVLALQTGRLAMGANTISLLNGAGSALTVSTGGLYGENTGNNSKVSWNIGTNTGAHTIPFENFSTFDIPFTFNLVSGDAGTLTVSTYPTAANNTPYPVTPQTVTNVNTTGGIDNSANTVNRFWQIDKTGANPVADLTFTYGDNEWDSSEPSDYNAQRYDDVTDVWQPASSSQVHNTATNTVYVPNVSTFSPWTLSRTVSPLAIDLADYIVALPSENTIVSWLMNNESEIYEYHIEKTTDFNDIELLKIESAGKSGYSFEDKNTWLGVSYYRVRAIDLNGNSTDFEWKRVEKIGDINLLLAFPNPVSANQNLTITGFESSSENIPVNIFDLNGKLVYSESHLLSGVAISLTIPEGISQGCYILTINGRNLKLFIR